MPTPPTLPQESGSDSVDVRSAEEAAMSRWQDARSQLMAVLGALDMSIRPTRAAQVEAIKVCHVEFLNAYRSLLDVEAAS